MDRRETGAEGQVPSNPALPACRRALPLESPSDAHSRLGVSSERGSQLPGLASGKGPFANQIQEPLCPRTCQRLVTAGRRSWGQDLQWAWAGMGALTGGTDLDSQPEDRPGAGGEAGHWKLERKLGGHRESTKE